MGFGEKWGQKSQVTLILSLPMPRPESDYLSPITYHLLGDNETLEIGGIK